MLGGVQPFGNDVTPENILDRLPAFHHLGWRPANEHGRRAGKAVEVRGGRFLVGTRLKERQDLARLYIRDRDRWRDHVKIAGDPGYVREHGWFSVRPRGADNREQRMFER